MGREFQHGWYVCIDADAAPNNCLEADHNTSSWAPIFTLQAAHRSVRSKTVGYYYRLQILLASTGCNLSVTSGRRHPDHLDLGRREVRSSASSDYARVAPRKNVCLAGHLVLTTTRVLPLYPVGNVTIQAGALQSRFSVDLCHTHA